MFIGDYLARRALYTPNHLAVIDAGKGTPWRLTYTQMNDRANRLANWLQDVAGIKKGDRVAILAKDGVEHMDVFFACSKLGAIHVALNWRLHCREQLQVLADTGPTVLVFSTEFGDDVREIQAAKTSLSYYLHIEGDAVGGSVRFEESLQSYPNIPISCEDVNEEDIVALIFTGGTTGSPKGAQVSHRMIAWNTLNTVIHDLHHDDIYLNVFPLFHTGGLFVYTLPNIIMGGVTILVRDFDPQHILDLIEREQVTVFAGVPTMYQMLTQAKNWDSADISSLRFCTSGGAPLPVPLVEQYTKEKKIDFKQGFGMTEFGPGIFALAPEDAIRKAGSIGRPNFFVEALIVNEEGQRLGVNQVGEMVLKGPSNSSGYFNNPEASAASIDENGFFHTGDLVQYDEDGYFYIVDRKKDMIISGGENIYPVEIERVLYQHEAVQMCAVVGLPNEKWGEIGVACVVLKPDKQADEQGLLDFMIEHLARYKVPKKVLIIDELPISAVGKILKRELRAQLIEEDSND